MHLAAVLQYEQVMAAHIRYGLHLMQGFGQLPATTPCAC